MITIQNVTKKFGRATAVEGVSLDIPAGDSVALWGGNGAGKTTLIRCVLGLIRCQGTVRVGGFDVRKQGKQARRLIGYVPQELGFYDDLGVADAVVFFARLKGLGRPDVTEVLGRVGLCGHERKRIRELSGGMKQRLALAVALLGDPPVLVLDEVTASLDACGREEFVSLLHQLSGRGRTMLFASHRVEEVTTLARRVAFLEDGRLGSVADAAAFMGHLGSGPVLHLTMAAGVRDRAMSVLSGSGFAPKLNGVGLLVPVMEEQKAAPFRVLADAEIKVEDFEVLSAAQMRRMEVHT
ncbi:MAG TPA: ABC transporter ATP-binding protein [Phycisphaerales bacterium]|nr:ABC transporter ATP-binding protein [Phycisphaerales bacterium]